MLGVLLEGLLDCGPLSVPDTARKPFCWWGEERSWNAYPGLTGEQLLHHADHLWGCSDHVKKGGAFTELAFMRAT